MTERRRYLNHRHLPLEERFWAKVEKSDGCWLWLASTRWHGYGQFCTDEGHVLAHRYALELAMGEPIPDGFKALHTCDMPGCVRNDDAGIYVVGGIEYPRWGHLWLGTSAANTADMVAKQRHCVGERNGNAKLTTEIVLAIRQAFDDGIQRHTELALMFGIDNRRIGSILRGDTWQIAGNAPLEQRAPGPRRGTLHQSAKLTADQVRRIRAIAKAGGVTQGKLATEYGVCPRTIRSVLHGVTYRGE